MIQGGYIRLGHLRGVPLLVHITMPLGAWMFSGFNFIPAVWLGFALLVFFHELGHALMVRRVGGWVQQVELLPTGGRCVWRGNVTPLGRACIAFAGVWMQLLLFIAAKVFLAFWGQGLSHFTEQFISVFTTINLVLVVINLLPVEPLDGAEAWTLFPLLLKRNRRKRLEDKVLHLQAELDSLEGKQQPSTEKQRTYLN